MNVPVNTIIFFYHLVIEKLKEKLPLKASVPSGHRDGTFRNANLGAVHKVSRSNTNVGLCGSTFISHVQMFFVGFFLKKFDTCCVK